MIVALSGLCVLVYGLQTVLSLAQSVTPLPPHKKGQTEGSLCSCRDGSVSTFSDSIDY